MTINKVHCLFEQSGTFKKEFLKLGVPAEDYDIQNDFGQTDHVVDLFREIENGYEEKPSIFDGIATEDLVIAFFPCVRFENQILLWFRGDSIQQKNDSQEAKLEKDLSLHDELHRNYEIITKLAIICIKRNLKLIIENPYSQQHYLAKYWSLKPSLIDMDRTDRGDCFEKPTQYWFIGLEPKYNIIFEPLEYVEKKTIKNDTWGTSERAKAERSMIHPQYANRFIREFIL